VQSREPSFVTAYLPNPYMDPRGLMLALADELDMEIERTADLHMLVKLVTSRLMIIAEQGKRALVCMDEVQAMPQHTLEAVRLLTNLETEKRKLLQVVLFGQPSSTRSWRRARHASSCNASRSSTPCRAFRRTRSPGYLEHRLQSRGMKGEPLFSAAAVRLLHKYTGGTPRLVNVIAHKALMLAFGEGAHRIEGRHIKAAAADTPSAHRPRGLLGWVAR
jgi:MSHA biogenesis protein MshM